jgi:hypothetical protein
MLKPVLVSALIVTSNLAPLDANPNKNVVLAENGKTAYRIAISGSATEVEQFAAQELQKYLSKMTGAEFSVTRGRPKGRVILLGGAMATPGSIDRSKLGLDGYVISAQPESIVLAGTNDRGMLFSVYAFLELLGCRWFAPNFDFYGPLGAEVVPKSDRLTYPIMDKVVTPSMKYRKEDVEEGRSHTVQSLRQIIDWMPKVGMNVFECPLNYGGEGITVWENWRADLIPELKRRDLLIEIGGHGYQNFLPQKVYFDKHPEWFGMVDGKRSKDERVVFETTNPQAVQEFLANIQKYLQAHPEINIFDLWPPDDALWSESPESIALGDPTRRHALVVSTVAKTVKDQFPRVSIEFLAYEQYSGPPRDVQFPANTQLDFCPIDRSFQVPLWDENNDLNSQYSKQLGLWLQRDVFKGDISTYTYYRKYSWRSLPILIPRLIAAEAKHYRDLGINGMSIYSEPANWFTFELNNYVLARATMDSNLEIEEVLTDYAKERFGPSWAPIREYFDVMEKTTPSTCRIQGTVVQSQADLDVGLKNLAHAAQLLKEANQLAGENGSARQMIDNLQLSLQYATNDLQIRLLAWRISQGTISRDETSELDSLFNDRRQLLLANKDKGIFLVWQDHTDF